MISPSPEFPITKPGMYHHRKREKPLRTYGQQRSVPSAPNTRAPDTHGEPPAKRRKSSHAESPNTVDKSSAKKEDEPKNAKVEDLTKNGEKGGEVKPAKGSIQFYFKPQPVAKPAAPTPATNLQEEIQDDAPSPERPISRTRRGPRLLRIRPASLPEIRTDEREEDKDEDDSSGKENHTGKGKNSISKSTWRKKAPLSPSSDNTTNQATRDPTPTEDAKRKSTSRTKATVQTTLNLSMAPAFEECKICNFVWNPLHPDDVKYHKKHHAAAVRSNKRKRENAGVDAELD